MAASDKNRIINLPPILMGHVFDRKGLTKAMLSQEASPLEALGGLERQLCVNAFSI